MNSNLPMLRLGTVVACAVALVLAFSSVPRLGAQSAQAQNEPPAPDEPQLLPYGAVNVRSLPHLTRSNARNVKQFSRHYPDAAAFQQQKAEANAASGLPAPAGGLAPQAPLTITPSSLTHSAGFVGMSLLDTAGYVPPDTQVAVGPNHVVEAVNADMAVFDRSGNPLAVFDLAIFFNVSIFTDIISDPTVRYDASSGHWFLSVLTTESLVNAGDWRLAVSATDDPTGTWALYMSTTIGSFPDFEKLGFSDDKVVLTGDAFTFPLTAPVFKGTEFLVIRKADLISSPPATSPATKYFAPGQGLYAIEPATSLSSTSTLYMAADGLNRKVFSIRVWSLTGVPRVGKGVSVKTVTLPIAALSVPPDAVQSGTPNTIATNDSSLLGAVYRNGSLWVSANTGCTPTGDTALRSCMHFTQISTAGTTPTVRQDFTFGENGEYYYYPAVMTDGGNNLISVFSRSSSTEIPSVYASGQKTTEPLNSFEEPVSLWAGDTPYTITPNRWGDYSGASIDPMDPTTIWLGGEYATGDLFFGSYWGTWIAAAHF